MRQWIPDAYYKNLEAVPLEELYKKGYRLALLDIDNTLAVHGSRESKTYADRQVERFREAGIVPYVLSNALQERAESFGNSLRGHVVTIGAAGKPGTKGIEEAIRRAGVKREETLLFGDQLFTDIWAGKRAGIKTVLLDRLGPKEPWYIWLKRRGESIVKALCRIREYYDHL